MTGVPVSPDRTAPSGDTTSTVLADQVAAAVRTVPGVADLHAGAFGAVATYLPGRRVNGVAVRPDGCEVHVALRYGSAVQVTADQIRAVVVPLVGTAVHVTVEDVAEPEPSAPPRAPNTSAPNTSALHTAELHTPEPHTPGRLS